MKLPLLKSTSAFSKQVIFVGCCFTLAVLAAAITNLARNYFFVSFDYDEVRNDVGVKWAGPKGGRDA